MFKSFSKLKLGLKITIGILIVEAISLASGITMGQNLRSPLVILGCLSTIVISQFFAYWLTKNIDGNIKTIIQNLTETALNLTSVARDLTTTGRKLAEGTTQQAASIQETSSTLEESASMIHQTTQNTKEADLLAKQTKDAADKGSSEMQIMLDSMEELKKSSTEISKIIKVIDEIAFQTNILSLNAAVEAARAGDAGKGFAVVAEEVRNLAQRSAQAAKDTAGIIEGNITLSEKCLKITGQVNGSLTTITEETYKVSELLEEISTASQEQEIGITQINQAISQMETVIQSNASTAQESASSADEVSIHSDRMKESVESLITMIDGANASSSTYNAKPATKMPKSISQPRIPATVSAGERRTPKKPQPERKSSPRGAQVINPEDIIPLDDF